ncbi:MAG: DUF3365 domain-containing protein [Deltaproteobacteria bacterium]|nr:DUF3365 domain-containing protein [Deltaproteobacteria bacterium]
MERARARMVAISAVVWVAAIAVSFTWDWIEAGRTGKMFAETEARSAFNKDLVYRRWAAGQGGVYVPPTDRTPPNPYLAHIPDRDVVTTDGKRLTLMNPAYMTRQVHELGREQYGARGHITSLRPIRPGNAPDAWETKVLRTFEAGAKEAVSVEAMDGVPFLRLMRPLVVEAGCLKCHASQGYRQGDIRGGISVSIQYGPYLAAIGKERFQSLTAHLLIGILGLAGVWAGNVSLRRSERMLREREELFRSQFEQHAAVKLIVDPDTGGIVDANPAAARFYGWPRERLRRMKIGEINTLPPEELAEKLREVGSGAGGRYEFRHRRADGSVRDVEVYSTRIQAKGRGYLHSIVHDVTDRKRGEEERKRLESELAQSEKMESIGRLAGGVAHDFNNMLMVILAHSEMAIGKIGTEESVREDLVEIRNAAERSAVLTRQMLAFARKQAVAPVVLDLNATVEGMFAMLRRLMGEPVVLDLNATVEGMFAMLRRLMGEEIDVVWLPQAGLWPVKMDPGQIDQILANLCANARDAIAGVGKVTIRTENASLDGAFCARHPGSVPGEYVVLSVGDDGSGMDKEILERLFEPFFTTKEVGRGTGLGLATVYGIVRQNNGVIEVDSEPGDGTVFRIYLPRHAGEVAKSGAGSPAEIPMGHGETILLVEDERAILELGKSLLEILGYSVRSAGTPAEAIAIIEGSAERFDLLLTDVVMPGMSGKELADRLQEARPGMKCLYMSGYTADVIAKRGILDEQVAFIQKPFRMRDLAMKLRKVLDS